MESEGPETRHASLVSRSVGFTLSREFSVQKRDPSPLLDFPTSRGFTYPVCGSDAYGAWTDVRLSPRPVVRVFALESLASYSCPRPFVCFQYNKAPATTQFLSLWRFVSSSRGEAHSLQKRS